jgi:hypothetical protein
MESFLAAITGRRGDDATAKAQDVMYEAWERTTSRSRIALARKALGISPLCADAGRARSLQELAKRDGITRRYIRRLVCLAFLSPELVEAILQGRQPVELTATRMRDTKERVQGDVAATVPPE